MHASCIVCIVLHALGNWNLFGLTLKLCGRWKQHNAINSGSKCDYTVQCQLHILKIINYYLSNMCVGSLATFFAFNRCIFQGRPNPRASVFAHLAYSSWRVRWKKLSPHLNRSNYCLPRKPINYNVHHYSSGSNSAFSVIAPQSLRFHRILLAVQSFAAVVVLDSHATQSKADPFSAKD